jgi:hypothetical protein
MNVAFFVRHFTERGTEVAIYDYAKYNEELLGNHSYIVHFSEKVQQTHGFPTIRHSYPKFQSRFTILEINDIADMKTIIQKYNIRVFYTLTYGGLNDVYQFENNSIWGNCKTIKHCVFDTTGPEGDFYISISHKLNEKNNTHIPVVPHMVHLPDTGSDNLRELYGIPDNAIVFGRYGGNGMFDIPAAREAIIEHVQSDPNVYFLFMNTAIFYVHSRIIYLPVNLDLEYKSEFIQTCDAMIHVSGAGETFGLAIAEFSIKNRPVITCPCGNMEHVSILQEKGIYYTSKESLLAIFRNIRTIISSRSDWNAYRAFSPENVMAHFYNTVFRHCA